jgi:hypothetical protein
MKKILLFLGITLLISCNPNKDYINLIKNYESTISDEVKMDLKFKCLDFKIIDEITGLDSAEIYEKNILIEYSADVASNYDPIEGFTGYIGYNKIRKYYGQPALDTIEFKKCIAYLDSIKPLMKKNLNDFEAYERKEEALKERDFLLWYDIYKNSKTSMYVIIFKNYLKSIDTLKSMLDKYQYYLNNKDYVYVREVECRFTKINPFLKQKQEITRKYYIDKNNNLKTVNSDNENLKGLLDTVLN